MKDPYFRLLFFMSNIRAPQNKKLKNIIRKHNACLIENISSSTFRQKKCLVRFQFCTKFKQNSEDVFNKTTKVMPRSASLQLCSRLKNCLKLALINHYPNLHHPLYHTNSQQNLRQAKQWLPALNGILKGLEMATSKNFSHEVKNVPKKLGYSRFSNCF